MAKTGGAGQMHSGSVLGAQLSPGCRGQKEGPAGGDNFRLAGEKVRNRLTGWRLNQDRRESLHRKLQVSGSGGNCRIVKEEALMISGRGASSHHFTGKVTEKGENGGRREEKPKSSEKMRGSPAKKKIHF